MEDEIIVIDRIEEAEDNKGKTYLKITDKAGVTRNFKEGRNNLLTNKGHLLQEGKAIKLHFQDYKTPDGKVFPFVKDFEVVEDEFVRQATEKVQGQVKTERNDSIEAQVAFKGMVELIIAGKPLKDNEYKATINWAMARIDLPTVIVTKVEEAKSETTKADNDSEATNQQQGEERTTGPTSGEALELQPEEVTNAGALFSWIMSKDKNIKAPRVWAQTEFGLSDKKVITDEVAVALFKTIKQKMGW